MTDIPALARAFAESMTEAQRIDLIALLYELPADHPLNTGRGIISLHSPETLTKPHMFIDLPYQHDKHDKRGRTCRNCTNMHRRSDFKCGCCIYGYDDPARNPRTRALKCRYFEHWRKALEQFIF